jgi:hypothetical protein
MRYLAVSFLRWGVTSCVMWGMTVCPSMPSFAASNRVALQLAMDHPVHPAFPDPLVHRARRDHRIRRVPQDRRVLAALLVTRGQVATRDRAAAACSQDQATFLDPKEALVPPGKAAAQGPADTPGRAVAPAAVDRLEQAAVQVAPVRAAVLAHRPALPREARVRQAHRNYQEPRAHLAAFPRVVQDPADQAVVVQAAVVRKADRRVDPATNPVLDHSPDHKVPASHQAPFPDHRAQVAKDQHRAPAVRPDLVQATNLPVAATAVAQVPTDTDLAPTRQVLVRAASNPVVLVVQVNRKLRAVAAVVVHPEVAAQDRQAVAVAHATTSGTESVGCPFRFPIRALLPWGRSKLSAHVQEKSRPVLVPTSAKPFTQDANKV